MLRQLGVVFMILAAAGCSRYGRDEIISRELPLSIDDIEEIRVGDETHKVLFEQQLKYKLYTIPELHAYVSNIGMRLARASVRPDLPYRFFIVDSDYVDLFGLPGGRIYITRGFFYFIDTEDELAGALAHEIGHIARRRYAPQGESKLQKGYGILMQVSEQGSGLAGSYGSAGHAGLRAIGTAAPHIKKRFTPDLEEEADRDAIAYMLKAGYDPRGLLQLTERLAKVPMEEVGNYVDYMKSHAPDQDRRAYLEKKTRNIKFTRRQRYLVKEDKLAAVPESPLINDIKSEVPEIAEVTSPQSDLPIVDAAALAKQ